MFKLPDLPTAVTRAGAVIAGGLGLAALSGQLASPGSEPTFAWAALGLGAVSVIPALIRRSRVNVLLSLAGAAFGGIALGAWRLHDPFSAWAAPYVRPGLLTLSDVFALERILAILAGGIAAFTLARAKPFTSLSSLNSNSDKHPLDVKVGKADGHTLVLKHHDRYVHTLIIGTTGTGKTSRVLKPLIWQDLQAIKRGVKAGLTVIEPKGDLAQDVAEMATSLGIPVVFLNPEDPATPRFNPLEGDPNIAAEIMRTVLHALFGDQQAFFGRVQEESARNTVLLLKGVRGDNVSMLDMLKALRDATSLRVYVEAYERKYGPGEVTDFFKKEALGDIKDKFYQFALGLRLQIQDIIGNPMMQRVLIGKSDVNLDRHLSEGGVLVVNTAMGPLGKLGDAFGQFIMLHLQYAVFRRPGSERTRTPHMLYVDEFPRYVNPDFERLLAIGRSFRCATTLALQTTAQLLLESKPAFRDIVLGNCRNKIILNLEGEDDAKYFAGQLGERLVVDKSRNYRRDGAILFPWRHEGITERETLQKRFNYTDLMELPKFHAVCRLVRDDAPSPPVLASLDLSPWDRNRSRKKARSVSGTLRVDVPGGDDSPLRVRFPEEGKDSDRFFDS